MGCNQSQEQFSKLQVELCILDKKYFFQNQNVQQKMEKMNISPIYFEDFQQFVQGFQKRYYNYIVTSQEFEQNLKQFLQKKDLAPKIFVLSQQPMSEEWSQTNLQVFYAKNYEQFIWKLKQVQSQSNIVNSFQMIQQVSKSGEKILVKILNHKNFLNSSQMTIFKASLEKNNIKYEICESFHEAQWIPHENIPFIVVDYYYSFQIVGLFKKSGSKSKIICLCEFEDHQEKYPNGIYAFSDNCLDTVSFIKKEISEPPTQIVKCTRVFLCTNNLDDEFEIAAILQKFNLQVVLFNNYEKLIKDAIYFFSVTALCSEAEGKNLSMYLAKNKFMKVRVITIPENTPSTAKGLFKIIRTIRKGYPVRKGITNSIDIIDRHYEDMQFQSIKKQLQENNIHHYGYTNVGDYITNKKVVSGFIVCNFQERNILLRYIEQVELKSKIIIFCSKQKITQELINSPNFVFTNWHFGKIIKYIKKTQIFLPAFMREEDLKFQQKIEKIKVRNKRISAIKWSNLETAEGTFLSGLQSFEFHNFPDTFNNEDIESLQTIIVSLWKSQCSIENFTELKQKFLCSMTELRKMGKINLQQLQFTQLMNSLKTASLSEVVDKMKNFFGADNELGLQINKTLLKSQNLDKLEIIHMKQFLLLIGFNFFTGFQMPRISKRKIIHWMSNPLIQQCDIGSFLFNKNFLIFYENKTLQGTSLAQKQPNLGSYKMQLQFEYNTMDQDNILLHNFINYKDKIIFSPFTQFQLQSIVDNGTYKTVTVRALKSQTQIFIKSLLEQSLGKSILSWTQQILSLKRQQKSESSSSKIIQTFSQNQIYWLQRAQNMLLQSNQSKIQGHKKLLMQMEQNDNYDSAFIDEIQYELAEFLIKQQKIKQASIILREVVDANFVNYVGKLAANRLNSITHDERVSKITLEHLRMFQSKEQKTQRKIQRNILMENQLKMMSQDVNSNKENQSNQQNSQDSQNKENGQKKLKDYLRNRKLNNLNESKKKSIVNKEFSENTDCVFEKEVDADDEEIDLDFGDLSQGQLRKSTYSIIIE